jgi:tetratricopeptide (TPR) repeat protein
LYKKALFYYPDHRAFLGAGIIYQKKGYDLESTKFIEMGLKYYPKSEPLHLCLGVSFMNMGNYESALDIFEKFPDSAHAKDYRNVCREAIAQKKA